MRRVTLTRETRETRGSVTLNLDGTGTSQVETGIGFLDHMLRSLARHAGFDLALQIEGDLEVDDHHTAEDAAILLGSALREALGERRGIARFGWAMAPLDEALARVAVDLSGRPWPVVALGCKRESIGGLATENAEHVLNTLAIEGRMNLHVDLIRGDNDHHRVEAAFKAVALSLKQAVALTGSQAVPSEKGTLS
ncbi:MAG: imidazoleglycerol-phosphate dehydratase HisB [Deltaproteobacteria bacterium]|nr:MAG: imidazoleglycerol-phosphate dehydratase HisB [Deltaproteobacteria bacterium]